MKEFRKIFQVTIRPYFEDELQTFWIRWSDSDDDPQGVRFNNDHARRHHFRIVNDPMYASDISRSEIPDKMIAFFHDIKSSLKEGESIKVFDYMVNTSLMESQLDKTQEIEWLRQKALLKLSEDEIRALGIEDIATYHKLKYHR